METQKLISVCLCTCKRPEGLRNVLKGLACQKVFDGTFEIIVVDNDELGSAKNIVDEFRKQYSEFSINYHIEPEKNISLARNRSISNASGQWLAFIDDDEIPVPEWLKELIETALHYKADGVFGPVISVLPEGCPKWIVRGGFFERKSNRETGDTVLTDGTRTGNALINASAIKRQKTLFDPRWGLTGGEDFHFFSEMLANGSQFVWSSEAKVDELIPLSRTNFSWLMKRNLRSAQTYADRLINRKGKRVYAELVLRGVAGLGVSLVIAPLMLPFGLHRSIWWLRRGAQGLGYLMALTEYRYEPYRT